MTFIRLLLNNLFYHWRGNLAVFLGVVVGTTVLTGALLVGDSLRGCLRELTDKQLGWVDQALIQSRFFRENVARNPENKEEGYLQAQHLAPAVMLQTTATKLDKNDQPIGRTLRKVNLLGVDQTFWQGEQQQNSPGDISANFWERTQAVGAVVREGVISDALAQELEVEVGDTVMFYLQKDTGAPRESLLGKRETKDVLAQIQMKVQAILPPDHLGSHFNLSPAPTLPRNAFLPLRVLQRDLVFQQPTRAARERFPEFPINVILVKGGNTEELQADLKERLNLKDWGLTIREDKLPIAPLPKYLSLESRSMFIPPVVQQAVQKTELRSAPTLVYLVNNLAEKKLLLANAVAGVAPPGIEISRRTLVEYRPIQIPYAIVAALDPKRDPPLGPFLPKGLETLADDEILVVDWQDNPLSEAKRGTPIALTYFEPNEQGQLREVMALFKLAEDVDKVDLVKDSQNYPEKAWNDPYLTPEFPGVTDKRFIGDLEVPFPFDRKRIRKRDEEFWNDYRTTPKAYITLTAGKKLWASRFGDITSLRIVPTEAIPKEKVPDAILEHLTPESGGFVFLDIRDNNLQASTGSQDFSGLFLGFSFFLIVAALLLIGLLFRLNIDRRASEIGLLMAVGYRRSILRWLLLAEGGFLALLGALMGLLVAVWYAGFLLGFLRSQRLADLDWSFLQIHITFPSLLMGYFGSVLVSVLTIFWSLRILGKVAPRNLLSAETTMGGTETVARSLLWNWAVMTIGLAGAVIAFVLGLVAKDHMKQATGFMMSGMSLLAAGLALIWAWMRTRRQSSVTEGGIVGLGLLGMRNAARHPVRSLLTMGLLAFATFMVVAVQAFHRDPSAHFLEKDGGSGGFPLLAEADVPIFKDLNSPEMRSQIADKEETKKLLDSVRFYPFRLKEGDDVSCLNLYKPQEPRILGVPESIIQRGGFHFAGTRAKTEAEKDNPWLLLDQKLKEKNGDKAEEIIPVFAEANTATWVLHKGLGDDIEVTDGRGQTVKLRIVGLLKDSFFQSELLMSDKNFRQLYPYREGFQYFLIETPPDQTEKVQTVLEKGLSRYGLVVENSSKKLETYLAVENMYLSTFQALGGLGLLLGALGLAVVLLRSVWERRGELALFRALGFRRSALSWMVLAENAFLLLLGLLLGTATALLSVAPHLIGGAEVLWLQLGGLLVLIILVGLIADALAVTFTLRAPLLSALRKE